MDALTLALVSLGAMLVLIALRVPIGIAMGAVAFAGILVFAQFQRRAERAERYAVRLRRELGFVGDPDVPADGRDRSNSGIGTALFRAAHAWFGGMPGGLAVATNWACVGSAQPRDRASRPPPSWRASPCRKC